MHSGLATADLDQNKICCVVQKHVQEFVQILPKHITGWNLAIQESSAPVQALLNKAEQMRHIEK